jgi:hypothetical protein
MEVRFYIISRLPRNLLLDRPDQHRIFDVLHWVKAVFKKAALDQIKEEDCLNREAFK